MPTIEEIRRQAELEGAGQQEINRRIAEAQTAGTLTREFTPEQQTAISELRAERARPSVGMYETISKSGVQPRAGMWQEEMPKVQPRTGALQEIFGEAEQPAMENPFARAPGEVEAQQVPVSPEEAQTAFPPLSPEQLAFEAQQPQPVQPGIQLPKFSTPSIRGLQKAVEAVPAAYKKAEGDISKAFQKQYGAIGQWAATEKKAAKAEADVLDARQKEYEALEAKRMDREQDRQDYVNAEFMKVRDAVDNLRAMKIDPTRFYRHADGSADYPKTIAAAVAIGLGALGSTLPAQYGGGGPNWALQQIDKAIDRDIQAQRDDLANQRAGVGLQMNLLGQMRNMYDDERKADLATKVAMLESYKMQLEATAARSGDARVADKAAMMVSETEQKQAQIVGNMNVMSAKEHMAGEERLFGARLKQTAFKQAQEAQQAKAAAAAAPPTAFPGARILSPKYAPSKEDEKAAKPMVAAWREASKQLNDLIAWRAKYGQEKLDRAALAVANTKLQRLKSAMRKVDETGARLDAGEIEMMGLDFEMGDLGFITERLTAVKDSVRDKVASRIHVHGYALEDQPIEGARKR